MCQSYDLTMERTPAYECILECEEDFKDAVKEEEWGPGEATDSWSIIIVEGQDTTLTIALTRPRSRAPILSSLIMKW